MFASRHLLRLAPLAFSPMALSAQAAACTVTGPVAVQGYARDACQKSADIFSFVIPQFAQALSGGGAMLGTANTLGGIGKLSLNVRVSAVQGFVPDLDALTLSPTGAQQPGTIVTTDSPVPAPAADIAVGLFPGFRVGRAQVLSIDGLVNVAYLPDVDVDGLNVVVPGDRLKFGWGGRVGLLRDAKSIPAISASYIKRDLPTADITADFEGGTGGTDQLALQGFNISTEAIRLSISKKKGFLEIGGGMGRDTYRTQLNISATVSEAGNSGTAATTISQELTRDIAYVSLAFNLPLLKIAAEVGQATGGTALSTFNTFSEGGNDVPRRFASAGVRVSF
jgi:hypothetical protein